MESTEKPFDQYCAELKRKGEFEDNVLTEDITLCPQTTNENIQIKRKLDVQEACITETKKQKDEENPQDEKELEEGELVDSIQESSEKVTATGNGKFSGFRTKRKVALLLSYCGGCYHGMQKNPGVETIELKLFEALVKIDAIKEEHKEEYIIQNLNQLVAKPDFIESINKSLPPDIRCFGIERVTKTFDAKSWCSGRSYEYLCPSFVFAPNKQTADSSYRLSDPQFELLNKILKMYEGTHNFHNFTSGKSAKDRSATRYITKFQASKPFECRLHEFISIEVCGQSFMIHQIRKMIGLCIAICRGYCDINAVEKSWENAKMDIPKAPGLGLLLNKVFFKKYNDRHGNDGIHTPLTWESSELEVERFKIEHIWHSIIDEEIKKSPMVDWLKTLANHTYSQAGMNQPMNDDYKGVKGQFPPIKKNE